MDGGGKDLDCNDARSLKCSNSFTQSNASSQPTGGDVSPGISDAVTNAMVSHFQKELLQNSMAMWPSVVHGAKKYFNVNHGYVLRKIVWQLVPVPSQKKKAGEISGDDTDWTARIFEGLEQDVEEPDLYIPTMSFITYVLLCGLVHGLRDDFFNPDVLSATIWFSFLILILEVSGAKAVLYMGGAPQAPVFDIASLLGYKYLFLSLQILVGVLLGGGYKPEGFFYSAAASGLMAGCGASLYQSLKRMARMQPGAVGQECGSEIYKIFTKALPALQVLLCWLLMPRWPALPQAAITALVNASGAA